MPNGEIFKKAASENRVLLTFDIDFGVLALTGGRRASVVLFRNARANDDRFSHHHF